MFVVFSVQNNGIDSTKTWKSDGLFVGRRFDVHGEQESVTSQGRRNRTTKGRITITLTKEKSKEIRKSEEIQRRLSVGVRGMVCSYGVY